MEDKITTFLKAEVEKIKKNPDTYMLKDRNATKHILYWSIGWGEYNNPTITNLSRVIMMQIMSTTIGRLDKKSDIPHQAEELKKMFLSASEIFN